eukprot:1242374-Amphidinium_carterae.3
MTGRHGQHQGNVSPDGPVKDPSSSDCRDLLRCMNPLGMQAERDATSVHDKAPIAHFMLLGRHCALDAPRRHGR